jgi:hypothetical protein
MKDRTAYRNNRCGFSAFFHRAYCAIERKEVMSCSGSAVRIIVCAAVLSPAAALAQQPSMTLAGPVPPAILTAKTISVSNAGADSGLFPEPFSGGPSRGYAEFYSYLKGAGQFELVNDPANADLVLELQLTAPNGPSNGSKQNGASDPLPMFRLVIFDRKTHLCAMDADRIGRSCVAAEDARPQL